MRHLRIAWWLLSWGILDCRLSDNHHPRSTYLLGVVVLPDLPFMFYSSLVSGKERLSHTTVGTVFRQTRGHRANHSHCNASFNLLMVTTSYICWISSGGHLLSARIATVGSGRTTPSLDCHDPYNFLVVQVYFVGAASQLLLSPFCHSMILGRGRGEGGVVQMTSRQSYIYLPNHLYNNVHVACQV